MNPIDTKASSPSLSDLFDELFPITRSISGDGYRKSISVFARYMDLTIHQYASGAKVFDWTVPMEWAIFSATLKDPEGNIVCDVDHNNLHVVNYSSPIDRELSLPELESHLYSLPEQPDLIPYVTSYYRSAWGFCITDSQRKALKDGVYHAKIDSKLSHGFVEVAEATLVGKTEDTFLISSYLCHPSMANNELSGPLVLLGLYEKLKRTENLRLTYKFVLNPETIGSICYLSSHGQALKENIKAGLVLTCLGGPKDKLSYKLSRDGSSSLDKVMRFFFKTGRIELREFTPCGGSDERQYCSPGFNLPVGQMARTVYGEYAEYHTSGDTKDLMQMRKIEDAVETLYELIMCHDSLATLVRFEPHCEIQLGKRDLYPNVNFRADRDKSADSLSDKRTQLNAISWVLNLADGKHDIIDITERSGMDLVSISSAAATLMDRELIYQHAPSNPL